MEKPSYLNFDKKTYAWKPDIDYREHPELYRVGKGEQGVLICQPYKNEIGQYWRFKNKEIAKESSEQIFTLFSDYLSQGDFVGADMARKYLQMGFTRARRYANYKGGKKYDKENDYKQLERGTGEAEKAVAADIFYKKWQIDEANELYSELRNEWKLRYGYLYFCWNLNNYQLRVTCFPQMLNIKELLDIMFHHLYNPAAALNKAYLSQYLQ